MRLILILLILSLSSCHVLKRKEVIKIEQRQIELIKKDSLDFEIDLGEVSRNFKDQKLSIDGLSIEIKNNNGQAKAKINRKPKLVTIKDIEKIESSEKIEKTKIDWRSRIQIAVIIIVFIGVGYLRLSTLWR